MRLCLEKAEEKGEEKKKKKMKKTVDYKQAHTVFHLISIVEPIPSARAQALKHCWN